MTCSSVVEPQQLPQATAPPFWSAYDLVEVRLEAALGELVSRGRRDQKFAVPAVLRVAGTGGPLVTLENVTLTTRGNTSRRETECEFPKLKLDFSATSALDRSPFAGIGAIKIGTHCSDGPDAPGGRYGRWPNEKAAHREAFIYRLLDTLDIPSLKARPARITYVQTDRPDRTAAPFVRDAMFLEDDDEALKRFGARGQLPEKQFGSAISVFPRPELAKAAFGQALIGNFDWCLRMHPRDTYRCNDTTPIWNVLGLIRPDGTAVPIIHDFDLAGIVTSRHIWFNKVFNRAAGASEAEIEVLAQVQRTRSMFPRDLLDATRRALVSRKAAAYAALAQGPIDPEGHASAKAYMDSFFAAIETDEAFYRPVIVTPAPAFLDAGRTRPACDTRAAVGTPVIPQAADGDMSRVVILDALWHWAEKCEAVRLNPVWIPTAAISREYPAK